jgi:transketolase
MLDRAAIETLRKHGIPDVFGESGTPEALYKHFKLDAAGIADVAKKLLG